MHFCGLHTELRPAACGSTVENERDPLLLLLLLLLLMDSREETMCHSTLLALGVTGSASGAQTSDWRLR